MVNRPPRGVAGAIVGVMPAMRIALCALALLLAVAVAPAAAQEYPLAPAPEPPAPDERISDEATRTYWAHARRNVAIRVLPMRSAKPFTRLRYFTEDGYQEVYLVLRRHVDVRGDTWLQVRVPMRPNGRTGWVASWALGPLRLVRTQLVVDRARLRARLYRSGRLIWASRIGIGTPATPTPAGRFWIRERLRIPGRGGLYGPIAFGTAAYSRLSDWPGGGVVGIHGTNRPQLIPGRPSHGCIRLRNRNILRLARLMPVGTPLLIR